MRKTSALIGCVAAMVATMLLPACAPADERGPVILAAASMQEALTGVAEEWERQGHPAPVLSFSSTPSVARQVELGAPADLVVMADDEWIDRLAQEGRLAGPPREIATNGLTAIAPRNAAGPVSLQAFADDPQGGRIAMAETEGVPAGRFARAALENLGLWDALEPRVVPGENVRVALALVERAEVPVGIVYASDAMASQSVRVIERLDPSLHPPIIYYAAQVSGSQHGDAEEFLTFLTGDQGRAIIASYGFGWP